MRVLCLFVAAAAVVAAQSAKYTGPKPEKEDVLYLLHASNLVETEVMDAKEDTRKDATANVVKGASSSARTPMAEPIFLVAANKMEPQKLELYKMDVKNGQREVLMPTGKKRSKDGPRPLRLKWDRLDTNIYRVEVNQFLENGEYCMSPQGSQQVFCFQVY